MRLLFARTLLDDRSAVVIQLADGRLVAGVAWLTDHKFESKLNPGGTNDIIDLRLTWQWWKFIESPEEFERQKEWERIATPKLIAREN